MIESKSIDQLINDKVDGLLDQETERQLDAWLQTHSNDARSLQKTMRTKKLVGLLLHDNPGKEYSNNFLEEFHTRLLQSEFRRSATSSGSTSRVDFSRLHPWLFSPLSAGIAAALVVMLTLIAYQKGHQAAEKQFVSGNPSGMLAQESSQDPYASGQGPGMIGVSNNQQAFPRGTAESSGIKLQENEIPLGDKFDELDNWFDQILQETTPQQPARKNQYPGRQLQPPTMNVDYSF
jgi:hypothetical protein